jgi:DnaJ family protein B protein 12
MEINKDEALRCLKIAKNQYGSKNFEAAVRLTKKSLNLFPTDDAKAFLEKAEIAAKETPSTPKQDEPQQQQQAQQQKEKPKSSGEQSKEVREILACGSDYYKVLKLEKKCTEVEIKKSYRKVKKKKKKKKNGKQI